jgi:hypothetical protein
MTPGARQEVLHILRDVANLSDRQRMLEHAASVMDDLRDEFDLKWNLSFDAGLISDELKARATQERIGIEELYREAERLMKEGDLG